MKKEIQKEVIILGMHRSGTSMLSGMLDRLGINMGDDLPGRQLSNPLGHYEDGDLLRVNELILSRAGGSWESPPSAVKIQNQSAEFEDRIQKIILDKMQTNQNQHWGWKDPRTCLTIELYMPYLRNPYIIWSHRDPADISKSLWIRNKMPPQKAAELTEYYQLQIREFVHQHPELPVLKISYRDILDKPEFWIHEVVDFLDLEVNDGQLMKATEFILPKNKIRKERISLWWKSKLLLPIRTFRKVGLIKKRKP